MPERKVLEPNEAVFIHEEMDSYNWNYLDQHICGDQEFNELMEVNSLLVLLTEGDETFTLIYTLAAELKRLRTKQKQQTNGNRAI